MIHRLKALAARLKRTPTTRDVGAGPRMADGTTYENVFGSHNKALAAAGLVPNLVMTKKTPEELIADLKALAERLKRTPTANDVNAGPGMADATTYGKVFGSHNEALAAAGFQLNKRGRKKRGT